MDAVLLSSFVKLKKGGVLLDLGTGNGILPILLSAKTEGKHFTGIEIQERAYDMALRSVRINALEDRIDIVKGDIKEAADIFSAASFDCVISNPPYMTGGQGILNPESAKAISRHEILLTFSDVVFAASRLLKNGGSFFLVHRPLRLPEIFGEMREQGIEPKRMRMVYPDILHEPSMVLIEGRKGGNPALKCEKPLVISNPDGSYTEETERTYGF